MLLVFTSKDDQISKRVISLLDCPYHVIYNDEDIENMSIHIDSGLDLSFEISNKTLKLHDINYIWHRRGYFSFDTSQLKTFETIKSSMAKEVRFFIESLNMIIKSIPFLSLPFQEHKNNKVYNLIIAVNQGLKTPKTLVCNSKTQLSKFGMINSNLITKGIYSLFEYKDEKKNLLKIGTVKADRDCIMSLGSRFFPSKFQEKVIKRFEIRTFYFLGICYSIGIMSQENEETKLDFRDYSVFTRIQRYQLPSEIEKKVDNLMKTLGLKIGVLDFIYGVDDEIYFLEVNPTGQIMRISELGNYQLDKVIANHLNKAVNG